MTMGDSMIGSGKKALVPGAVGIGAGAVLEFIKVGFELTTLRPDVRDWLMMGITMFLFAAWGTISKRARGMFGARDRASDR